MFPIGPTRAGAIPGIHTIEFEGPSDTIELTHTARDDVHGDSA